MPASCTFKSERHDITLWMQTQMHNINFSTIGMENICLGIVSLYCLIPREALFSQTVIE